MDDEIDKPRVQAEDNSIAIGEINISGTVTGNISIGHTIIQAADAQLRHDLGILLKNVQTTWIKGVLERSVHEAALLDLGMEIREEAVDNPWRMVMEALDQTRETLPRGKRIKDIFYEANGLLLMLGEPGSGKTTTLLQLARDLIAEVDQAFTQPVPVILNLSTWINKEQPLNEWLVAELNSKYRVPKKDGQKWLEGGRVLPLLDGLDDVKAENRAACVEKINQLVKEYGLSAVVCSRIQDYTALNVRLGFYRAIYIQPLTPEQVDEYLRNAGDKLASLRTTLQADEALKAMAQSPLILNIMSLAYQNTSAETLSDPTLNTNEARRRHLFDTYIARMFKRKASERPYSDEQTKQWLSWLAQNLQKHNQEVFLIENLQPTWILSRHWQWVYFLASRSVSGLIFALSFASIALSGLVRDFFRVVYPVVLLPSVQYISTMVITGLVLGLSVGFLDILRFEWIDRLKMKTKFSPVLWAMINIAIIGLLSGLVYGFVIKALEVGLLFFGPIFGVLFGLRDSILNPGVDIQTTEAFHWSWRKASKGGLIGVAIGLFFTPLIVLFTSERFNFYSVLDWMSFFPVMFGGLGAVLGGLRREIVETKSIPNQGIRLSIRNAMLGGIVLGLTAWIMNLLDIGLSLEPSTFGLLGALWYGGLDIIQHYTLRLILVFQRHTSANYARFLDYAVDRIFLQKVGGGYRFIHRLLLEHFAEMSETTKEA